MTRRGRPASAVPSADMASDAPSGRILALRVNGERRRLTVPANRTLLEVLREDLGLTGTKHGCELGECGACTVLVNGIPRLACLTLAAEVEGAEITTVEGLAAGGAMNELQAAFSELGVIQCGYCTPGVLMSAQALLNRNPAPSTEEVRNALSGNICRCSGYVRIVKAVKLAGRRLEGRR